MRWYKRDNNEWQCLHCDFKSKYTMGIQNHIRKHKRQNQIKENQVKLSDEAQQKHLPFCKCGDCVINREITGQ